MSSDYAHGEQDSGTGVDRFAPGETRGPRSSLERHQIRRGHARRTAQAHAVPKRSPRGLLGGLLDRTTPEGGSVGRPAAAEPSDAIALAENVVPGNDPSLDPADQADALPSVSRQTCLLYVLATVATLVVVVLVLVAWFRTPRVDLIPVSDPTLQPHFDAVWQRTDRAVQRGEAQRGWTWGQAPLYTATEPYRQATNGMHTVQYYDKGRLEISDPAKPDNVTQGLLVREMVAGQIALGDLPTEVEARDPAGLTVAGDPLAINPDAPTYASFHDVASLAADRPALDLTGGTVTLAIDRQGVVGLVPDGAVGADDDTKIAAFEPVLKHNIPTAFWRMLHRNDVIYENGQLQHDRPLFDPWQAVTGLPITEAYWINTQIAGVPQWVLVQLFERRVLTYTPSNAPEYRVEMGNSGRHYLEWRYGLTPEEVTPVPAEDY